MTVAARESFHPSSASEYSAGGIILFNSQIWWLRVAVINCSAYTSASDDCQLSHWSFRNSHCPDWFLFLLLFASISLLVVYLHVDITNLRLHAWRLIISYYPRFYTNSSCIFLKSSNPKKLHSFIYLPVTIYPSMFFSSKSNTVIGRNLLLYSLCFSLLLQHP